MGLSVPATDSRRVTIRGTQSVMLAKQKQSNGLAPCYMLKSKNSTRSDEALYKTWLYFLRKRLRSPGNMKDARHNTTRSTAINPTGILAIVQKNVATMLSMGSGLLNEPCLPPYNTHSDTKQEYHIYMGSFSVQREIPLCLSTHHHKYRCEEQRRPRG